MNGIKKDLYIKIGNTNIIKDDEKVEILARTFSKIHGSNISKEKRKEEI